MMVLFLFYLYYFMLFLSLVYGDLSFEKVVWFSCVNIN